MCMLYLFQYQCQFDRLLERWESYLYNMAIQRCWVQSKFKCLMNILSRTCATLPSTHIHRTTSISKFDLSVFIVVDGCCLLLTIRQIIPLLIGSEWRTQSNRWSHIIRWLFNVQSILAHTAAICSTCFAFCFTFFCYYVRRWSAFSSSTLDTFALRLASPAYSAKQRQN